MEYTHIHTATEWHIHAFYAEFYASFTCLHSIPYAMMKIRIALFACLMNVMPLYAASTTLCVCECVCVCIISRSQAFMKDWIKYTHFTWPPQTYIHRNGCDVRTENFQLYDF